MFRRSHCYFFFPVGCPVIATPPCLRCGVDWDTQSFTLAFIQWLVWDPVASFSRSILLLLLLILETRLPHSVMWCALSVCHHQCRRRTERSDSSGFFSRGCTVLLEGNGGESVRGPFREKRTKTRIFASICAVSEPDTNADMLNMRQNECHTHVCAGSASRCCQTCM